MKATDQNIAEYIHINGFCTNETLAKQFNVSEMTIRRSLARLEEQGMITRVRSGALSSSKFYGGLSRELITNIQKEKTEKYAIADHAVQLIQGASTIFLDAGSSTYYLARKIPDNLRITVITHSLDIIEALQQKPRLRIICPGGELDTTLNIFTGHLTENALRSMGADISFMGAGSLDISRGTEEATINQIPLKSIMTKNASRSFLLLDSTKFGHRSYFTGIPIEEISHIITTDAADKSVISQFRARGITMDIAETGQYQ